MIETIFGVIVLAVVIWGALYLIGKALIGGDNSPFANPVVRESGPRVEFKILRKYQDYGRDGKCYDVIEVQANNYMEVCQIRELQTIPGDVSKVVNHVGRNRWKVTVEPWDTEVRQ